MYVYVHTLGYGSTELCIAVTIVDQDPMADLDVEIDPRSKGPAEKAGVPLAEAVRNRGPRLMEED